MKLYILRHGKTQWNALRKVQGAADIPLAEEGISLARKVGETLKDVPFDLCFSSPLKRAIQTAELVLGQKADRIPVILDKRIQEIDFGALEGTQFKDEKGNWGFTAFGRTFLSSSRYVTKYRAMQNCEKLIRSELKSLLNELTPTENISIDDEENPYLSTIEKLKSMFHM